MSAQTPLGSKQLPKKILTPGGVQPKFDPQWVVVGRFSRSFGVKGQIYLESFTEPAEQLVTYQQFFLFQQQWTPIDFSVANTPKKKNQFITHISGITTPEQAAHYTGYYIAVKRESLAPLPPEEYYWHDLIGCTVINLEQQNLGDVTAITHPGAHPLFVVNRNDKKHMIPFTKPTLIKISLDERQILVDWPQDF